MQENNRQTTGLQRKALILTIFYDSYCPLCMMEMKSLMRLDKRRCIRFVDINAPSFARDYPLLDWQQLNARLHALNDDGVMIKGLDVTHAAWKAVGRGALTAPLRWMVIRPIADLVYLFFAKHRYRISFFLTGQRRCQPCEIGARPSDAKVEKQCTFDRRNNH